MKKFPAFINRFLVYLQLNDVKGKYGFYLLTAKVFRRFVIEHKVNNQPFFVPYDQWCFWKNYGPNNYYLDEMLPFTQMINESLSSFDFIDLGADIGTVSGLIKTHCPKLNPIIAVEPNPTSYHILKNNHQRNSHLFNCAVSDFEGHCQFNFQLDQGSDHEGHIDPTQQGDTEIKTLDALLSNLAINEHLVIKIDVEGQEKAVFRGAHQTIKTAKKLLLLLELHPDTLSRDNLTPEDIFIEAESIADIEWFVPLLNNKKIDRNEIFFQQFPLQQYDVIGLITNN